MRKIFLFLISGYIFIFSTLVSKALTPSDKTSEYIIFPFNVFESLSYTKNYYETLPKYFDAAKLHCGTHEKSAYIFYKIDNGYRVYDQYEGGFTGSVRFICAMDENEALRMFNYNSFSSMLHKPKFQSSRFYFEMQETNEVTKKRADQQLAIDKERQKKIEAASIEAKKLYEEKKLKEQSLELIELEKNYGKKCKTGISRTDIDNKSEKFTSCLREQEAKELAIKKKSDDKLAEKNVKIALEENKKQIAIQQKQELDQNKIREEQIKISKMKPEDKHAYTCAEKFGFRKGSDKFKDCVFKIYQAELELEKLELQRELAKANAETAKAKAEAARASEERQQNLARAQAEAATMQAIAARQQAIAANTASSLQMIESGLRMMSPQQSNSVRLKTNCTYIGRDLSCF